MSHFKEKPTQKYLLPTTGKNCTTTAVTSLKANQTKEPSAVNSGKVQNGFQEPESPESGRILLYLDVQSGRQEDKLLCRQNCGTDELKAASVEAAASPKPLVPMPGQRFRTAGGALKTFTYPDKNLLFLSGFPATTPKHPTSKADLRLIKPFSSGGCQNSGNSSDTSSQIQGLFLALQMPKAPSPSAPLSPTHTTAPCVCQTTL